MDLLIYIIVLLLLVLIGGVFYLARKVSGGSAGESSVMLQNQLNQLSRVFDQKISETNSIVRDQLSFSSQQLQNQSATSNELLRKINENNSRILREVTEKLVKVEDTNSQVVNFAQQLQSLENIFKNPKKRGIVGEYFLEGILSSVLPVSVYEMQYHFSDAVIVDAIIRIKEKLIPVDAKFSLESYNVIIECDDFNMIDVYERDFINDVKKRIDETSKYVKPEENTVDIAFMFVPSDGVYNEIIELSHRKDIPINIISYAYSKKVVVVSPTSFFAYLQTVLLALNTIQVEGHITEMIQYLNESTKYIREFEESMDRVGKNISTLVNSYNKVSDSAKRLSKRIAKVSNNERNLIEIEKLEN